MIADSGYPNLRKVITPFKRSDTRDVSHLRRLYIRKFNKKLSKGRILVVNTIGCLRMRFPVLKQTARIRKKNVSTIVLACGILHNLLN